MDLLRPAHPADRSRWGRTRSSRADTEMAVLPLSGGPLTVDVEGRHFELDGRATVFGAVTDWAYLPIDAEVRLSSTGGAEVALPSARATRRFEPALRRRRRRRRRGPWRRSGDPPGHQLHVARERSTAPTS